MKFKRLRLLVGVCLLIIACIYTVKLVSHHMELKAAKQQFSEIASVYHDIKDTEVYEHEESEDDTRAEEPQPIASMESLIEKNKDTYAWLNVEGTNMDYPVMFTPGNPEFYLRRNFDGQDSIAGTPFFDGRFTEEADNYIVYGHHMKNGTMFADLIRYSDSTYFNDHSVIRLTTLYREREYEVIAAFYSELHIFRNTFPWYEYITFEDEEHFLEFVEHLEKESLHSLPVMPAYGDKFITLVTCSYHDSTGRFVVIGKEVRSSDDDVTPSSLATNETDKEISSSSSHNEMPVINPRDSALATDSSQETTSLQPEETPSISSGNQSENITRYTTHVIQPGETFFSLSRKYYGNNSGWKEIMNYNGMTQGSDLKAGATIRIPD